MNGEFKGFRFGVLECSVKTEDNCPILADFVSAKLSTQARSADALSSLSLIELGSVYVNSERALNPSRALAPNDQIRIHSEPRRFQKPLQLRDQVIEENLDYVSIFKPAGLPSGPTVDNLHENLLSYLSDERRQFLHLIHSIDTDSEGILVFAKSLQTQEAAQKKFADNQVTRILVAFVERAVEPREYRSNIRVVSCEERLAETSVLNEGPFTWAVSGPALSSYARLEVELRSGRPVEVRDLLAALDSPVIGDRTHGSCRTLINPHTSKPATGMVTTSFRF